MNSLANKSEPEIWPEMMPLLDEAVAELGSSDRDALILRFYEQKALHEVGRILGLNVDTAQKRVSRAVEKLRRFFAKRGIVLTATSVVGAISANAVQAAPVGLAGTISSAALTGAASTAGFGLLSKSLPILAKSLGGFPALLAMIAGLPTLAAVWFMSHIGRLERANFRDQAGFRRRLHQAYYRRFFWGFLVILLTVALLSSTKLAGWGIPNELVPICAMLLLTVAIGRSLLIAFNAFYFGNFAAVTLTTATILGAVLNWIPHHYLNLSSWLGAVLILGVLSKRPVRMDYSFFLRAEHQLLGAVAAATVDVGGPTRQLDGRALVAFGRFLGERFLVSNFRWSSSGLVLRLPSVKSDYLQSFNALLPPFGKGCSTLLLAWDGTASANCGKADARDLAALVERGSPNVTELERRVSGAVDQAWWDYRQGNLGEAERKLGSSPDSEIFHVAPGRSKAMRLHQTALGSLILIGLALQFALPIWRSEFKAVRDGETKLKAFVNEPATNVPPGRFRPANISAAPN
jgi:hypothetical protein